MPEVHGNTEGVRKTLLERLKSWYGWPLEDDEFVPQSLIDELCGCSAFLNREVAVYITRYGEVAEVLIGRNASIDLPDMRLRRSEKRLSMIRCIHTHPGGSGQLSDVDISALKTMRLDSIAAIGVKPDGSPTSVGAAFLDPDAPDGVRETELTSARRLPQREWMDAIARADETFAAREPSIRGESERAVLVGIESESSLAELAELAATAGATVIQTTLQKRTAPDRAYCIGKGKAQELALDCQALHADLVIADEELTGVMQKNLEAALSVKVIDRTALILDIFASRARTREGKLQVEMAQLKYRSQRLLGEGVVLSRLAGGIGTRGPGESKLEVNRRRIRERLYDLEQELERIERQRGLRRKEREKNEIPIVALVGYTNAGKSTLFKRLTGADVYIENQLFATLDSVSRRVETPHGASVLLVDTVGFIRKLPHELVKAFRATLEEAALADLLVIVSDAGNPELHAQHATVLEVLESLGAGDTPRIDALNKCDQGVPAPDTLPGAVCISALRGDGADALMERIEGMLGQAAHPVELLIPFARYGLVEKVYRLGQVTRAEHEAEGVRLTATLREQDVKLLLEEGANLSRDEI